jgi:hypothetical protein
VRISGSGTEVSLEVDGSPVDTGSGQVPEILSDEGTGQIPEILSDEGTGQIPEIASDEGSGQIPEISSDEGAGQIPEIASDEGTGVPAVSRGRTIVIGPTIVTGACGTGPGFPAVSRGRPIPTNPEILTRLEGRDDPAQILAALASGKDEGRVRHMDMKGQVQTNWCWAAVGASIQESVTTRHKCRQCRVADLFSVAQDACHRPHAYNRARSLALVLDRLERLYYVQQAAIASFDLIRSEIERDRPVCARIAWDPARRFREDGAHFVAIGGWSTRQGQRALLIFDPFTGGNMGPATEWWIEWNDFRTVYRSYGRWVTTYFVKET